MPNWVTTHLTVTGPADQLTAFKEKASSVLDSDTGRKTPLTFGAFIPMPPSLTVEASSDADLGYAVYHGGDISRYLNWPEVRSAGVTDRDALMLYLDATRPNVRKLGDTYAHNLSTYGVKNWYDWSIENWGTKWDACRPEELDASDGEWRVRFDTAWSPAEPVLQAMSEQFPELEFVATFDEESHMFFYEATWNAGVKTDTRELERDGDDDDDEYGGEDD